MGRDTAAGQSRRKKADGRSGGRKLRGGGEGGRGGDATASALLTLAREKLGQGDIEEADACAGKALRLLNTTPEEGAAVMLAGQIKVELGDLVSARGFFLRAVDLDPDGAAPERVGGGAEKFLWLAQLSDEGGEESVVWFERGVEVLRAQLATLDPQEEEAKERRKKLAGALCGMVEIYMTDLSWSPDAEAKCESYIAEALLVAPSDPETLQTLANIRISQNRMPEAKRALLDSLALWQDLSPADPTIPAFPTRISLSRLLMEVSMEEQALGVLERLVGEDDQSVEAWYLGGWCLQLLSSESEGDGGGEKKKAALVASREWLNQSLILYDSLEYEDERLREHAEELVRELDALLGPVDVDGDGGQEDEDGNEEGWESEDGDEDADEEMVGS